jgi:hypothetical protein
MWDLQVQISGDWIATTRSDGSTVVENRLGGDQTTSVWLAWNMSAAIPELPARARDIVYHARNGLRHCFRLSPIYRIAANAAMKKGIYR